MGGGAELAGTHHDGKKEPQTAALIHSKSPQKTPFLPVTRTHVAGSRPAGRAAAALLKARTKASQSGRWPKGRRGRKQDRCKMDLLQKKGERRATFKRGRNAGGEPKVAQV